MMKKIMLVDDVDISNFIMKKMIAKATPQHLVYDFVSPEEALEQLKQINPDLIFLDLNMPVVDGWEFLATMEQRGLTNNVLILTSSTSEIDRNKSRAFTNVLKFLVKPIQSAAIASLIEAVELPAKASY